MPHAPLRLAVCFVGQFLRHASLDSRIEDILGGDTIYDAFVATSTQNYERKEQNTFDAHQNADTRGKEICDHLRERGFSGCTISMTPYNSRTFFNATQHLGLQNSRGLYPLRILSYFATISRCVELAAASVHDSGQPDMYAGLIVTRLEVLRHAQLPVATRRRLRLQDHWLKDYRRSQGERLLIHSSHPALARRSWWHEALRRYDIVGLKRRYTPTELLALAGLDEQFFFGRWSCMHRFVQLSDAFGQLYREEVHANEPGRLLYAFVAREQRQPWAQGPVLGALSDWVRFRRPRHERSDSFQYGRAFRRQLLDEVAPLPVHSCTMHACAMPTPTHWRLTPRASSWKAMEGHGRPHATGFELEGHGRPWKASRHGLRARAERMSHHM